MRMRAAVRASMPGRARRAASASSRSAPGSRRRAPSARAAASAPSGSPARPASSPGEGKRWVRVPQGASSGLRVPLDEPRRLRPPGEEPHGHLVGVGGARRAQTGPCGDERGEARVGAEPLVDGVRVGVQVEQAPQPPHGRGQVAQVGEVDAGRRASRRVRGAARGRGPGALVDGDDARAVRQPQGAPVGAGARRAGDLLDAVERPRAARRSKTAAGLVGAAVGEAQGDAGGGGRWRGWRRPASARSSLGVGRRPRGSCR